MKYQMIYADPPWAYLWGTGKNGGHFAPEKHYPTMPTADICALDVKSMREKNCALALWSTAPCMPDALRVMDAWGFKYKTVLFTWVKLNPKAKTIVTGPGSYTRSACEFVLLGMRGHVKRISTEAIPQVVMAPRTGHSVKPPVIREHLVSLFGDVPRIELFARSRVQGWAVFGNEVRGSVRIPKNKRAEHAIHR